MTKATVIPGQVGKYLESAEKRIGYKEKRVTYGEGTCVSWEANKIRIEESGTEEEKSDV